MISYQFGIDWLKSLLLLHWLWYHPMTRACVTVEVYSPHFGESSLSPVFSDSHVTILQHCHNHEVKKCERNLAFKNAVSGHLRRHTGTSSLSCHEDHDGAGCFTQTEGSNNLWDNVVKWFMFNCATLTLFYYCNMYIYCQCQNNSRTRLHFALCTTLMKGISVEDRKRAGWKSTEGAEWLTDSFWSIQQNQRNCPITTSGVATNPSPWPTDYPVTL